MERDHRGRFRYSFHTRLPSRSFILNGRSEFLTPFLSEGKSSTGRRRLLAAFPRSVMKGDQEIASSK